MTSSNFIDLLVAIFAMVLMLMAHRLVKSFLDHIFPGGHGHGPGALISGMMEGMGMEVGKKMFRGGMSLGKTGVGLTGAAGIAGVASALGHLRNKKAFGEDGFIGAATQAATSASSVMSDTKGLYPGALPPGANEGAAYLPPTGFTMMGMDEEGPTMDTGATDADSADESSSNSSSSSNGGATYGGTSSSFKPSGSSAKASKAGLFDSQSSLYGAKTQLRPSATSRLNDLSEHANRPSNALDAFMSGATNRLANDVKHKFSGERGRFAGGANSLMGVAKQEFGGGAEAKIQRDSYLPSAELTKAAREGDQYAISDMAKVGQYQSEMDQGLQWYEQGTTLQNAIQPDYEAAQMEYDEASQDLSGLSVMKSQYEASGDTSSPMYQGISAQYETASQRHAVAEQNFGARKKQYEDATGMITRGEQRMLHAQSNISKINMNWYPSSQQSSGRILQAAQARAKRTTLSDLGKAPGGRR